MIEEVIFTEEVRRKAHRMVMDKLRQDEMGIGVGQRGPYSYYPPEDPRNRVTFFSGTLFGFPLLLQDYYRCDEKEWESACRFLKERMRGILR